MNTELFTNFKEVNLDAYEYQYQTQNLEFLKDKPIYFSPTRLDIKFCKHQNELSFKDKDQYVYQINTTYQNSINGCGHLLILKNESQKDVYSIINLQDGTFLAILSNLNEEISFVTYYKKNISYFRHLLTLEELIDQSTRIKINKLIHKLSKKITKKYYTNLRRISGFSLDELKLQNKKSNSIHNQLIN